MVKSLLDIEEIVDSFLIKNESTLKSLCLKNLGDDKLSYDAFKADIIPKLKITAVTFYNSNYPETALTSYLFPTIYAFFRESKSITVCLDSDFICPACAFLSKQTVLHFKKVFKCSECSKGEARADTIQKQKLFQAFKIHSKRGFRCNDCTRFIPQPLDNSSDIVCPYYDCIFVGKSRDLKSMRHPTVTTKIKELSLDAPKKSKNNDSLNISLGDSIASTLIASDEELELKERLSNNLYLLKDIIQSQINSIYYSSAQFTLIHKVSMYQAFLNIIDRQPEDMVAYLVFMNRHGGFQHKIFQEYIAILESKMPFSFIKNGKNHKVSSLLDPELSLFDGISTFDAEVNLKNEVKNNTSEFYVGGRTGFYSRPFYIGKLLDITNVKNKHSIMQDVNEYSFSKIKLNKTLPQTKVQVTHLRVPPHYQMGGLVYLNRIRRKIVDKVHLTLHGSKRDTK